MTASLRRNTLLDSAPAQPATARPPGWVGELLATGTLSAVISGVGGLAVEVLGDADVTLVTVRVPGGAGLDAAAFQAATSDAYGAVAEQLRARRACHPVRFWAYVPDIQALTDEGLDRYMVFNAGRYDAMSAWLGGPGASGAGLATGSAVGHAGTDLVVYCLAAAQPCLSVENPRQVPAYRYSPRYGPKPPYFARAGVVRLRPGLQPCVLVGGTASVRGEASMHAGDLEAQAHETLENLRSVASAACGGGAGPGPPGAPGPLARFRDLRVYHPRRDDEARLRQMIARHFPALERLEFTPARLCRRELLVEIEGVAALA